MNQTQRKFLIERIQQKTKEKIEALKKTKWEYPNRSTYLFQAIMQGTLKLKSQEQILEAIRAKALSAKEGENWLSGDRMGWEKERYVKLPVIDLMELPEALLQRIEEVKAHNDVIDQEIDNLKVKLETIEVRVQLASDRVLQNLINEVDDMGDLKLIDTTVKRLN